MSGLEALAVVLAGVAAGTINTIVGSGTLITFPTLLAVGLPPVTANISNNLGLLPGGAAGVWGYRRELAGQARRLRVLAPVSAAGGLTGAAALLVAPESAFATVVPVLIGLAVVLVLAQPRLQALVAARRVERAGGPAGGAGRAGAVGLVIGTLLTGAYGGYFGAAQGVLLVGLLGSLLPESLQRVNAAKNVLTLLVNGVSAVVFVALAGDRLDWAAAGLVAAGSLVGGLLGARIGRRLAPRALRAVSVVVGVAAIVRLVGTA